MTALHSDPQDQTATDRTLRTEPNDPGVAPPDIAELLTAVGIGFEVMYDGTAGGCPSHRRSDDRAA